MKTLYAFIMIAFFLVSACSSADITLMGVKKMKWSSSEKNGNLTKQKVSQKKGIYDMGNDQGGVIYGQVISDDPDLASRSQVSFTIQSEDYTQEKWTTFFADAQGHFRIENLPANTYKVAVTQVHALLTVKQDIEIGLSQPEVEVILHLYPTN